MIRQAKRSDSKRIEEMLSKIKKLHRELYPKHFKDDTPKYCIEEIEKLIEDKIDVVLVVEEEREIVGYLIGYESGDYFFVDDIYVEEEYQNQHFGYQLMLEVESLICHKTIRLNVWEKNKKAVLFYEKLGFKVLKYVMEKEIQKWRIWFYKVKI